MSLCPFIMINIPLYTEHMTNNILPPLFQDVKGLLT